jgi:hypothetical protein
MASGYGTECQDQGDRTGTRRGQVLEQLQSEIKRTETLLVDARSDHDRDEPARSQALRRRPSCEIPIYISMTVDTSILAD